MPKNSKSYELALPPRRPGVRAYQWLYDALRSEILRGRLPPRARLPASRDLARQYGLSRGTVVNAFDQLASEGYVQGTVGSGTFVSKVMPEQLLNVVDKHRETRGADRARVPQVSKYARSARLFAAYENRPIRAFRANLPALDLFPTGLWTQITTRCLRRISARNLMGCDPLGHLPLRQTLVEYLGSARGVRCVPEQVAIVSGVQEALDLTARILLDPGDWVCTENPGYPGALRTFQAYRAKVFSASTDVYGVKTNQLPTKSVRLIYVTPAHQFPLCTTMSIARRLELLAWAHRSGAMIFEDDYDSEYRYSGRPVSSVQGLDNRSRVLYAGTFSKVLFPALRLAYLVVPLNLVDRFEAALSLTARHAPLLEQIVLAEFIQGGYFGRHLRRMREVYAERVAILIEEAESKLDGLLEISNIEAGLQTVGWLRGGIRAKSAAAAAAKYDVDVTPIDNYSQTRVPSNGLQLGFAALDPREIRRGVRDLASALESEIRNLSIRPT